MTGNNDPLNKVDPLGLRPEDPEFEFPAVHGTAPGCTENSWDCYLPPNGEYILWPSDFEKNTSHPERVRYISLEQRLSNDVGDWRFQGVIGWPKPDPYTGNYWGVSFYGRTDTQTWYAQSYKWIGCGIEAQNAEVEVKWDFTQSQTGAAGDPQEPEPGIAPVYTQTDLIGIQVRFLDYLGYSTGTNYSHGYQGEFNGILLSRPKSELLRCITRSSNMNGTWDCTTAGDWYESAFSLW